jgi:hypothetical protein
MMGFWVVAVLIPNRFAFGENAVLLGLRVLATIAPPPF